MAMAEEVIEMPALGRPFQLGMLYDCRKDALIPGITLWDYSFLQKDLIIKPQHKTESEILVSDTIDDKFNAVDISGSLKASFLGGMIEVGGSAKYLQDTKKSKQQARVTVQYKTTTRYKQLTMRHLGIQNISYPVIFEQGMATHVVTAILYGAQAFFVFDREVSSTETVKTIKALQGKLQDTIKKILSLAGQAQVKLNEEDKENVLKFSCKFHGDFSLERNPVAVQDAIEIYATLPKMLGEHGEKAVPVWVWLHPLIKLDTRAAKMVHEISLALIFDVEKFLEELNEIQMQSNDLANDPIAETFPEIKNKIQNFKDLCRQHRETFQKELARVLPSIRGGGQEEGTLVDILISVNQSPFNSQRLREFLDTKKREMNFVKSYLSILDDMEVISSQNMLEEIVLDSTNGYVVSFILTSLHEEEPFLLTLRDWLRGQFLPESAKSTRPTTRMKKGKAWFEDKERTRNARQAAKSIKDFLSVNPSNEKVRFVVASLPDVENPGASIYLYEDGELVSKNFELPSKPLPFLITELRHDSIQLKFQPAELGRASICSYVVEYKIAGKENEKIVRTEDARETFLLKGLLPNTEYQFHYTACCKLGLSKTSDPSPSIKTLPTRHPEKLRKAYPTSIKARGPIEERYGPKKESELRIVLFERENVGKDAVGDTILESQDFASCYQTKERLWKGRKIKLMDTTQAESIPFWLYASVKCGIHMNYSSGSHAIIHVLGIKCFEPSGQFFQIISEGDIKHYIILLFNGKENLKGKSLENFLSTESEELKKYIAECGNRCLAFDTNAKGEEREAQMEQLIQMIDDLVERNHHVPYLFG